MSERAKKLYIYAVTLILSIRAANCLYSSRSPVEVLNSSDFVKKVVNSERLTMVEFFANWCGHCQQFAPEYEKAAKALKGIVNFVAVEDTSVMGTYNVKGYPTVMLFIGAGGSAAPKTVNYNGNRVAKALVDFVIAQINVVANNKLSGKSSSSNKPSDVVLLTDANFDKLVLQDSKSIWFVNFYSPKAAQSKSLSADWEALASRLKKKVKVGKVDGTKEVALVKALNIETFPALKLFPLGKKSYDSAVTYEGARSVPQLSEFALKYYSDSLKAQQLINEEQFQEECKTGVCIITFLPSLYEVKAETRSKQISILDEIAKQSVDIPIKLFWMQGGDQFDMEEKLNLAFGYPAVIAMNLEKMKFGIHRGAYTEEGLKALLTDLKQGRLFLDDIPKNLPKLKSVSKWNGKDINDEEKNKDEL